MRVLGLDIGEKRIGVAISDPSGTIASPLVTLDAQRALADGRDLARLVDEYEVSVVVVGLPLSLDGAEGPQAARVRKAADRLASLVEARFEFADERLSSVEASRSMTSAGVSERGKRGQLDMVAAALFLQAFLDAHRNAAPSESS